MVDKGRRAKAMSIKSTAAVLGLVAAIAVAASATWAIAQDNAKPSWPVPTSDVLAKGLTPSQHTYEITKIEADSVGADPSDAFCFQIRTMDGDAQVGRTQGCNLAAHALDGREMRPSYTVLATDRFITLLAPAGVETMEVSIKGDPRVAVTSEGIPTGETGKLLVVMVGGPMVTSRDPKSFQEYEVRLLDAKGNVVHTMETGDSR